MVIPEAAAPAFTPRSAEEVEEVRRAIGLPETYLLWVGGLRTPDPRKRIGELARAPRAMPLVLVGPAGRWARELPDVILTGEVSDDDLAAIYTGAHALVVSSDEEGFGLTRWRRLPAGRPSPPATSRPCVRSWADGRPLWISATWEVWCRRRIGHPARTAGARVDLGSGRGCHLQRVRRCAERGRGVGSPVGAPPASPAEARTGPPRLSAGPGSPAAAGGRRGGAARRPGSRPADGAPAGARAPAPAARRPPASRHRDAAPPPSRSWPSSGSGCETGAAGPRGASAPAWPGCSCGRGPPPPRLIRAPPAEQLGPPGQVDV